MPGPSKNPSPVNESPEVRERSVAKQILQLNLRNLAEKVRAGKTLSTAEVQMLNSRVGESGPQEGTAESKVALADAIGVTRQTIHRWLRMPGNPGAASNGKYSVGEWRDWARKNGYKMAESEDSERERFRSILLGNEILEYRLGILRHDYVLATEVESVGAALATAIRKVVLGIHLRAPSLANVTVAEADGILKGVEDEIIEQLHTLYRGIDDVKKPTAAEALAAEAGA